MNTKPKGLDADWVATLLKVMSRTNVWLFKRTGGRLGATWRVGAAFPRGVPICLLSHTGRRTGQQRTTPLVYLRDAYDGQQAIVVVASQAGRPAHPAWYLNVVANPEVTVQIGRDARPMRARTADPAERARLWPRLVELYADFDSYQSWTDREIPVVICTPH